MLKFFPHPEGYVEFKNNQYLYTYQYKDHLGNIRLAYRDGYRNHPTLEYAKDGVIQVTEIIEENNYYPFGLKQKGNDLPDYSTTNKYKYAYGGKELNDELGLDLYDFGARNYDPTVGRFFNIDRLSEKYESLSPYNYTANNPVRFIDVDGEWIDIFDPGGEKYRYMMGGDVQIYNKKTKEWSKVEDTKSLSLYVQQVAANLYELETSGLTGSAVIGYFNNDSHQANFKGYKSETYATPAGSIYVKNGFKTEDFLTVNGFEQAKMFVIFGHELSHVIDKYENPKHYQDTWAKDSKGNEIIRSEIFATHIENQIRAESGLPLREYYGVSQDMDTGRRSGLKGTLLLDSNNSSLYFRQTQPSIFNIENRGEIINQKIKQIKNKDERYRY